MLLQETWHSVRSACRCRWAWVIGEELWDARDCDALTAPAPSLDSSYTSANEMGSCRAVAPCSPLMQPSSSILSNSSPHTINLFNRGHTIQNHVFGSSYFLHEENKVFHMLKNDFQVSTKAIASMTTSRHHLKLGEGDVMVVWWWWYLWRCAQ